MSSSPTRDLRDIDNRYTYFKATKSHDMEFTRFHEVSGYLGIVLSLFVAMTTLILWLSGDISGAATALIVFLAVGCFFYNTDTVSKHRKLRAALTSGDMKQLQELMPHLNDAAINAVANDPWIGTLGSGALKPEFQSPDDHTKPCPKPQELPEEPQPTHAELFSVIDDIYGEYTTMETNPLTILERPALLDITVEETARFHVTFHQVVQHYDRLSTTPLAPATASDQLLVLRLEQHWDAAVDHARRVGLNGASARDKRLAHRLVDRIMNPVSDNEREADLAQLIRILSSVVDDSTGHNLSGAGIIASDGPQRALTPP